MIRNRLLALLGTVFLSGCVPSKFGVGDVDVSTNNAVKSRYVASGFVVNDNPVVQSDVTLSTSEIPGGYANIWGNFDTETGKFSEVDFTLGRADSINDKLNYDISASHYDFGFGDLGFGNAQNIGVTLSTANLPVDLEIGADQIFGDGSGHGRQYTFSVSKGFDVTEALETLLGGEDRVQLSVGVTANYNDHYFTGESGFGVLSGNVGLNSDLGNGWSAKFGYEKQTPLDEDKFGDTFPETDVVSFGFGKSF
jgi:uncharacterized protein (TIGR02001 family)